MSDIITNGDLIEFQKLETRISLELSLIGKMLYELRMPGSFPRTYRFKEFLFWTYYDNDPEIYDISVHTWDEGETMIALTFEDERDDDAFYVSFPRGWLGCSIDVIREIEAERVEKAKIPVYESENDERREYERLRRKYEDSV